MSYLMSSDPYGQRQFTPPFGLIGPSITQMIEDPKLGLFTLAGVPFLSSFFASDEARKTAPEFAGIWNSLGL